MIDRKRTSAPDCGCAASTGLATGARLRRIGCRLAGACGVWVGLLACSAESASPTAPDCEWTSDTRPTQLGRLGCPADHAALAAEPVAAALPASQSVLFAVERNRGNALHFFDSRRFRHYTFARERLEGYGDLGAFNAEMYLRPERRLFLGTLTHYLGPDLYALELAPIDKAEPELIAEMFGLVRERLGWALDLRYHPSSNALELEARLPAGVPIVRTEELYENAQYQGMHLGKSIGQIHLTTLERLQTEYVSRTAIVVVDRVPNDLPVVAGLVTGEFQTPLAHVNLLSQNRGTPNMALKGALSDSRLVAHAGKWVELAVRADGFSIAPSTAEAAAAFWEARRPPELQVPALDLSQRELVDIVDVDASWIARIGGKAANYGEMANIEPALPLPVAFAVPCSRYLEFMDMNGITDEVHRLLDSAEFRDDGEYRKRALTELRARIEAAPVDPGLVLAISERARSLFGEIPTRLRSSSNVEDLSEFNGAGLYESETYEPAHPKKTLERALRRVWSSLWTFAAYEERDWARVDQRGAAMGVLVHRSFPDVIEAANGVAVTANPFDPPPNGQAAYFINVQIGAASVANPLPGDVPESLLYYKPPAGQGEMSYLSRSSLNDGDPVLSFEEIVTLVGRLKQIHDHFARRYPDLQPFGMDVEFKFVHPGRELSIKQARPYPF